MSGPSSEVGRFKLHVEVLVRVLEARAWLFRVGGIFLRFSCLFFAWVGYVQVRVLWPGLDDFIGQCIGLCALELPADLFFALLLQGLEDSVALTVTCMRVSELALDMLEAMTPIR